MPHIVTQSCCSDASCVYACPVNCIHPTPDEPDFLTSHMLYIDPKSCVDCGACVSACPVEAIVPHTKLEEGQKAFIEINADFYRDDRPRPSLAKVPPPPVVTGQREGLRVAVIGAGPAGMFAADELLTTVGTHVTMFEKLSRPYGLARSGVAPDHDHTRQVTELFDIIAAQPRFEMKLGVEVGKDVTHEQLLSQYHAVIYTVGASSDRFIGIPGEDLAGVGSATEFVGWYNGHPDYADREYDLSHPRVVIVGNGNVALDVARILTLDPERLASTDISRHALNALRASKVEEVLIVGRRGIAQSAFTIPEFVGLSTTPGIALRIDPIELSLDQRTKQMQADGTLSHTLRTKLALADRVSANPPQGERSITMRFLLAPQQIDGDGRVESITLGHNLFGDDGGVIATGETERIEAGLVLRSVGYLGRPIPSLPFDDVRGVVPNEGGRVVGAPRTYVSGWIKRGPSGFIGTNKSCAQETVHALVDDFNAGLLPRR